MTAPGATAPNASVTTQQPPIGATSSGGTQPRNADGTFAPQNANEWRYASDFRVPWMRGKTAEDVAALSDQMYAELVKRQPAPSQAAPAPTATAASVMPSDDLWLTNPTQAGRQLLDFARQNEFLPAMQNMAQQLGSTAREVVKRDYADDFRKWGPEIDLYINQMDPQYRTIDNIGKVVGMVRANHIDEIAAERAQKRLDEMIAAGTVLRPGAAPNGAASATGGAVDLSKAGLPDNYTRVLQRYGITSDVLDEFLMKTEVAATGCTLQQARDKWLERAKAGDIIVERPSGAIA